MTFNIKVLGYMSVKELTKILINETDTIMVNTAIWALQDKTGCESAYYKILTKKKHKEYNTISMFNLLGLYLKNTTNSIPLLYKIYNDVNWGIDMRLHALRKINGKSPTYWFNEFKKKYIKSDIYILSGIIRKVSNKKYLKKILKITEFTNQNMKKVITQIIDKIKCPEISLYELKNNTDDSDFVCTCLKYITDPIVVDILNDKSMGKIENINDMLIARFGDEKANLRNITEMTKRPEQTIYYNYPKEKMIFDKKLEILKFCFDQLNDSKWKYEYFVKLGIKSRNGDYTYRKISSRSYAKVCFDSINDDDIYINYLNTNLDLDNFKLVRHPSTEELTTYNIPEVPSIHNKYYYNGPVIFYYRACISKIKNTNLLINKYINKDTSEDLKLFILSNISKKGKTLLKIMGHDI